MAEAAGLVLGVLGISGLFAACVENFDIVVRGKKFSREFELLCTQVRPRRRDYRILGQTLRSYPYNEFA